MRTTLRLSSLAINSIVATKRSMDTCGQKVPVQETDCSSKSSLTWVVHPLFARPLRGLLVTLLLAVLLTLVYLLTTSLVWVVFSGLVLAVSLRQFFLPTTFHLCDQAVVSRFLWFEKRRDWKQLKSYFPDRNGVLLSPFSGPSRLENFRGFYLIGANRRPEVMQFIRNKLNDRNDQ